MKNWKQPVSALLAAALVAGMLVTAPASAAGQGAGFTDISDPVMSNAAEVLRLLDVVDGTGSGAFNPNGTLTRAEFCKMTVEIIGRGGEEPAQRSRTLFTDVGSSHWARGYVNLASTIILGDGESGTRLIMGVGDGTFRPDRPITYGEAATILMRVLGYSNADVASGVNWYDGYVAVAESSGLSGGLNLSGGSNITRGQAAILFYNLLFTKAKGSNDIYLTQRNGRITDNVIILSTDAKAADGTGGSVRTADGNTYKTNHAAFSSDLNGTRARLVLDGEDKVLTILPDEGSTFRSVVVMGSCQANVIPVTGNETISVRLTTPVYSSDGEQTTYESLWTKLRTGVSLVLCYNSSGQLDYIYQRSSSAEATDENTMVAKSQSNGTSNPFVKLTGMSGYQIYKNGIPAEVSDIQQYDVGTWDSASKTLFVSNLKLTGLYENVYPNSLAPSTITMMGHDFDVLPSAIQDLSTFKVGDRMTLLLTAAGQVAGAVSTDVAKGNAVGVAEINGTRATVKLLDGLIELEGGITYNEATAAKYSGRLVAVSSTRRGYINLSQITGNSVSVPLDLETNTLGTRQLSAGLRIFEQVGNGKLVEIERSDIVISSIPAAKITYASYDWAGRVDKVVLNDVTGDRYDYGQIYYRSAGLYEQIDPNTGLVQTDEQGNPITVYENGVISVTNGSTSESYVVGTAEGAQNNRMGGVAGSLSQLDGKYTMAGFMPVQSITGLRRSQFDIETMTLTTNSMVLPISKQVQIYNDATDSWYDADYLQTALEFSDDLTAYYDRTPEEGGKVRILVIK